MARKLKLIAVLWLCSCRGAPSQVDFETSLLIQADVGGTLTVGADDDPQLAGTSLTLSAGALFADTTITVSSSTAVVALPGTQSAGPTLTFGPPGTVLRLPATVTLPFALPTDTSQATLSIAQIDDSGNHEVYQHAGVAIDGPDGDVGFEILSLGTFGAVVAPSCGEASSCTPSGEACLDSICSGVLSADVNLGCGLDGDCLAGACDGGVCETGFDAG